MYDQVADIAADITSGALAPGARLPTEIELAAQYQVSHVTIRRAVKELTGRGLVVCLPRQGDVRCRVPTRAARLGWHQRSALRC